tara:strand:+ start:814 stop:1440 length:627 start_codon:yes stop_codon:yes gene_type:complete
MVSAANVKELRELSGAGMMDCKKALEKANNDISKAMEVLRKEGIAKAQKKSGRSAKEGVVIPYIHPGSKLGVLLEVNCETDFVANTEDFQSMCKDISMHIAASSPMAVNREEIDDSLVSKEKEIFLEQAKKEGKPDEIANKIVEGRVNKFFQENVLMEQSFVKDPDKTVGDIVTETIAKLGENIVINRYVRFQLGEKTTSKEESQSTE